MFLTQSPSFGNFVTYNGGINERIHGVFRGPLTRAQSLLSQNERVQMTHLSILQLGLAHGSPSSSTFHCRSLNQSKSQQAPACRRG